MNTLVRGTPTVCSDPTVIIRDDSRNCWLRFSNPSEILAASRINEVRTLLRAADEQTRQGKCIAGFISYEAAPAFDSAFQVRNDDVDFPLLWLGIYNESEQVELPVPRECTRRADRALVPTMTHDEYGASFRRIKEHISSGDTYQVNLTYRLRAAYNANPWTHFVELASALAPRYGAYLDTGNWALCSLSPELFFRLNGDRIESRPMKGTAPRGLWCEQDALIGRQLRRSEKDCAENVMIVDMVRNDLGRIASMGSVRVPSLFSIERHPTVWQMTSTVTASTSASLDEIFESLFPPASVTGAPKASATGIIAELESSPRRLYTGAIGFATPGRNAQFSVAIRTLLIDKQQDQAEYGTGGGIVWDSQPESELAECEIKTRVLHSQARSFDLLETMLWKPHAGFFLLNLHLKRLRRSAAYFGFSFDSKRIEAELADLGSQLQKIPQRIRLLLTKHGSLSLQYTPLREEAEEQNEIAVAESPIESSNPLLYHKTTDRRIYEHALASHPGFRDVLLHNERNEITESTLANVIVELDGALFTPPVSCGLLQGTYREWLIERKLVRERSIVLSDALNTPNIFLVNSVRGMRKVVLRQASDERPAQETVFCDTSNRRA